MIKVSGLKPNIWDAVFVSLGFATIIIYLALINYRLPFLTVDDFAAASTAWAEQINHVLRIGRPSLLIGDLLNLFLAFHIPNILELTPRFVSMVVLVAAIFLTLRRLSFAATSSVLITGFAILTHQLDWQHNGLIAFFGGYNLRLGFFLLALIALESFENKLLRFLVVFVLIVLSFSSELFVGLAIIYVLLRIAIEKNPRSVYADPLVWAITLYLAASIFIIGGADVGAHRVEQVYLTGALERNRLSDMAIAALLYYINSIPLYSRLDFSKTVSVALSLAVLLPLVVVMTKALKDDIESKGSAVDGGGKVVSAMPLIIVLAVMGIAPQCLIALSTQKYDWIMSGASTRYLFSLYTWVSLVLIGAVTCRKYAPSGKIVKYIVAAPLVIFLSVSVANNMRFANEYKQSKENWLEIDKIVREAECGDVKIPVRLLSHPYILPVDDEGIKKYIKNVYKRNARVCVGTGGYDLSYQLPSQFVNLIGFSGAETPGRWTSGSVTNISFMRHLKKFDVIELTISDAFSENAVLPTKFNIGSVTVSQVVQKGGVVRLEVNQDLDNPVLDIHVPKPVSPASVGVNSDSRIIGIMIKKIRLIRVGVDGLEQDISEVCY